MSRIHCQAAKFCLLLSLLTFFRVPAAAQAPETNSVAIVYDADPGEVQRLTMNRTQFELKGYIHALFVENLLGHFGLSGEIIPLREYKAGQLRQYRAVFFVGVATAAEVPKEFLADVKAFKGPICWLGQHIEALVGTPEGARQYGFTFQQYNRNMGVNRVRYKNELLTKGEQDLVAVSVTDKRNVQVVAEALARDGNTYPYALHKKRFWFMADSPFAYPDEGGHYLAFCDLLHDILEIQHAESHRALIRIEDVSIDDDVADLRRVADLLQDRKTPFQIALIPIFRNPSKEYEVRITQRRSLVDALHYMIARGGTPLLHGVTHQYRGQSGDDYEFWDETGNHSVAGDSTEFVLTRLRDGLQECFAAGIYPVAFETPHYAASATDYKAMMRVFSLFYDRTISTPSLNSMQYFPYPVTDIWGRQVIPESLGYLPEERPDPAVIVARAKAMRVVRDGIASFYFHPFLKTSLLGQAVDGVSALGYKFISVREFSSQVNYQGRLLVRTAAGKVRVSPQNEFLRIRQYDAEGNQVKSDMSSDRRTGPFEVSLDVPKGGWTAVDCLSAKPTERREPTWSERAGQWWEKVWGKDRAPEMHGFVSGRKAWVLTVDKPTPPIQRNQESYRNVLDTYGYITQMMRVTEFVKAPATGTKTILIVPQAAGVKLNAAQQKEILRYLGADGPVVFEGRQDWLKALGFAWSNRQLPISVVSDEIYPEMYLRWRPDEKVELFAPPETIRELMVDTESSQVLAFSDDYGSGHYIHLATMLDPYTTDGMSHYPYFAKYLADTFGMSTSLRSPRVEAYYDPAYRPGADLNRLAEQWRKSGIRIIYAAVWNTYSSYYPELVKACHRHGVAVYAWFNLPQATPQMWEKHPEWRERNAAGTDERVGWRYILNLQRQDCFRAVMDWTKNVLTSNEWDGVNISELNFDGDFKDYMRADKFMPMSDEVRNGFRRKGGFDPIQLFSPSSPNYYKTNPAGLQKFLRYRENIVTEWHRSVLKEIEPLRKQRGWEVIVTMMDSLHHKVVRPMHGLDSAKIAGLMKEFDFTLQVEDPAWFWMKSPDRYQRFAKTYAKLVKDPRRLMFDINVVQDRDVAGTSLPSATATGTELARTMLSAANASAAGRVAVYSEHTVPPQDWQFLRIALSQAGGVSGGERTWRLDNAVPTLLAPSEDRDYYLDGKLWPAVSEDGVLAPKGHHVLSLDRPWHHFLDPGTMPARMLSISGDLLDARVMPTGLIFRYSSPGRAVVVLNQRPREILVDGHHASAPIEASGGTYAVMLPGGDHWVALVTNSTAGVAVNLWGWASASAITAFGSIATLLMILIYFEVRLRRFVKQLVARG